MLTKKSLESAEDYLLLKKGDSSPVMFLLENPRIFDWLKFRSDSVTRYFKQVSDAIQSVNPKMDFRFNTIRPDSEMTGMDLIGISKHVQSIRMMDYTEQKGDPGLLPTKERWLANVRRQVGHDMPIIGGIAPRGKATPDMIRKSIFMLADNGVDGLSFGFYDCAPMENLRAIRQGIEEAGVTIRPV